MNEQQLKQFLGKLASATHNSEEYAAFVNWLENCSREEYEQMLAIWEEQVNNLNFFEPVDQHLLENIEKGLDKINGRENRPVVPLWPGIEKPKSLWARFAAAVAVIAILSIGVYQYIHKAATLKKQYANDIVPGTAKPILTLANGQKIVLGNKNGFIANQGAVSIKQTALSQLTYTASKIITADAPFNTLTNPRGSKVISLILPDGTLAKLDAESSITYQTAFTGKARHVTTTGKVYFEVNYNKNQPFYLTTKGQITRDLGTHFIVEAYDDEPAIKTTLIEGSVEVSVDNQNVQLKPGEQSLIGSTHIISTRQADLDDETAWLKGDFDFHNQDMGSIMRELARAYNIDVSYKGNCQNLRFDGMVSRSRNISAVLQLVENTGQVHFEIKGRRVMVIAGMK